MPFQNIEHNTIIQRDGQFRGYFCWLTFGQKHAKLLFNPVHYMGRAKMQNSSKITVIN